MSALSQSQAALRARPIAVKGVLGDLFCFLVPALMFLSVHVGGVLFASDVCLMAAFPFVVYRHREWLRTKPVKTFLCLGALWLVAQVVTDIVRHTPYEDYSRGWSKIFLTLTHFATIALLIRNSRKRLVLYGAGLTLGGVLTFLIEPNEFAENDPWKFGLAIPITLIICLAAGMLARRNRIAAAALLAAIGALNILLGFRSLGAICLAAAIYSYFRLLPKFAELKIHKWQGLLIAGVLIAGMWGIFSIYGYGAKSGLFGEIEREKYAIQSSGVAGLLLGGRSEILVSSVAIYDSPLIGHGSWAKDPFYQALLATTLSELGYESMGEEEDSEGLIPTHSYLFGAWVESGIVGALFWFWVLWCTAGTLLRATGREPMLPFFAFVGMLLAWNVLFSPYGAEGRFTATYFVYAMMMFRLPPQAASPIA
jgi:hypothetical protein